MPKYKVQHFVPQMHLRQFEAHSGKENVYIQDGISVKLKGIGKICQESYFYDFNPGDHRPEIAFSKVEGLYSKFFKTELFNIKNGHLFYQLTEDNKDCLLYWMNFLFLKSRFKKNWYMSKYQNGKHRFFSDMGNGTNELMMEAEKKSNLVILLNKTKIPFVTGELPAIVVINEKHGCDIAVMSLSPEVAICVSDTTNPFYKMANDDIAIIDYDAVHTYNLAFAEMQRNAKANLISNDKAYLKNLINEVNKHEI